jgi:hypothetical protein
VSSVVKLPRSVWDPFKALFPDIPSEVFGSLLDAIDIKVSSCEMRTPISMIWSCTHEGHQYTSPLQMEIIYEDGVRYVAAIKSAFYTDELPTMDLLGDS